MSAREWDHMNGTVVSDDEESTEAMQMRANLVTDSTLESTRRMVALCVESEGVGVKTLDQMWAQGDQLSRIEGDMDHMNADMRDTEKTLTQMEKWCGLCLCPCTQPKRFSSDSGTWTTVKEKRAVVSGQPRMGTPDVNSGRSDAGSVDSKGYIIKVLNDAREEEMEGNMGEVSNLLGALRNMALDMGQEMDAQNQRLDTINRKAESNEARVQAINDRASKLAKDSAPSMLPSFPSLPPGASLLKGMSGLK
ncbi:unnamed protein product [Oppiella nova]|uniref:Synaptosomal-associated protein n=1 Tax=Oppiella nova TaxID=334625 RepID=A0A7R9MJE4_9ACAR|nr:unnamed protein product [Oppiella nova]CAG2178481.1 unnamed protein product [Oppiella nova]